MHVAVFNGLKSPDAIYQFLNGKWKLKHDVGLGGFDFLRTLFNNQHNGALRQQRPKAPGDAYTICAQRGRVDNNKHRAHFGQQSDPLRSAANRAHLIPSAFQARAKSKMVIAIALYAKY